MDNIHLQIKNFIDEHPDVDSIRINYYSNVGYFVLSIRCLDKDSKRMKENSKAIRYYDLPFLMDALSMIYNKCQYIEEQSSLSKGENDQ